MSMRGFDIILKGLATATAASTKTRAADWFRTTDSGGANWYCFDVDVEAVK